MRNPAIFLIQLFVLCLSVGGISVGVYAQTPSETIFLQADSNAITSSNIPATSPYLYPQENAQPRGVPVTLIPENEEEYERAVFLPEYYSSEKYLAQMPEEHRQGVFQKINFNTLWVPKNGNNGLGMTELDWGVTFAVPMLKPDSPLVITPNIKTTFFDPGGDLFAPTRTLYNTGVSFRWIHPIVPKKLTATVGTSVSYNGDFKVSGSDAIRVPIHLAGIWNCNPRLKLIFGVAYLDRKDGLNWIPMAGLIWTPDEDLSVELVLPRMRVLRRVHWFGSIFGNNNPEWVHGGFELAGGSWNAEMGANQDVRIEYRDLKFLFGYERRTSLGVTLGLDVGYMFARKMEYDGGYSEHPNDNVFLRIRTAY